MTASTATSSNPLSNCVVSMRPLLRYITQYYALHSTATDTPASSKQGNAEPARDAYQLPKPKLKTLNAERIHGFRNSLCMVSNSLPHNGKLRFFNSIFWNRHSQSADG